MKRKAQQGADKRCSLMPPASYILRCNDCHSFVSRSRVGLRHARRPLFPHFLRQHSAFRHIPPRYECHDCPTTAVSFIEQRCLWLHQLVQHMTPSADEWLWCSEDRCGYRSRRKSNLQRHVREQHLLEPAHIGQLTDIGLPAVQLRVVCDRCGYSVKHKRSFIEHYRTHQQDDTSSAALTRMFACASCPKAYRTYNNLRVHQRASHELRSYACHECGRSWTTKVRLRKHIVSLELQKLMPFSAKLECYWDHIETVKEMVGGEEEESSEGELEVTEDEAASQLKDALFTDEGEDDYVDID